MATAVQDPTWNIPGWTDQYVFRQIAGATAVPVSPEDANLANPPHKKLINVNGV